MTLIDEIDESRRLGDAFGNNAHLSEIMSDAKVLRQKIKDSEIDIISLFQDIKSMKEAGLITGDEILEILEILISINDDVKSGNYQCDKIGIALKNVKREKDNIDNLWNRYLRKEIGAQKGIVETLQVLVEDTQRYLMLTNLYNEIVGNRRPGDSSAMSKIETYKTLSDKMVKDLNLKPSVMRFFEKMASKSVLSLKEMTPEIWKWIQDNDFEDKFTIKIADRQ